jgi:hypothetical protein
MIDSPARDRSNALTILTEGAIRLGAVVLAFGYELFMAWLSAGDAQEQEG